MQTAYQLLSVIVLVAIPMAMLTGLLVEYGKRSNNVGSEQFRTVLRLRNLEVYLLGVTYPIKAVVAYFTPAFQPLDILWGILWLILAVYLFKKYRFGDTPADKNN